jgi:DNA (cytosine-5)-methyltransferase 1
MEARIARAKFKVIGGKMKDLTHLSLFSGIGGLDLAAEWAGFRTVGQCEWADFPRAVLEKHWPGVPRWRDIRELTADDFYRRTGITHPTVVSGGFPCQPHSLAGKRLASDDERDLWSELFRVFCETDARWLVAENVGGLLTSEHGRFFGRVLRDLAQRGCHVWWYCFPAHAAGAPFWGERIAIVAAAPCIGRNCLDVHLQKEPTEDHCGCLGKEETRSELIRLHVERIERDNGRGPERNDDGIPAALDRLKCYGNAVMPQQFFPVFRAIAEVETG